MEEVRKINDRGQVVYSIEFNGKIYRRYPNGKHPNYYYYKHKKNGVYYSEKLHHAVYESVNGKIPEGKVIHHIDCNPLNNEPSNLMAVTPSEHAKIHDMFHREDMAERWKLVCYSKENWHERRKKVLANLAKEVRVCENCGAEFTPTNTHQRFCTHSCYHKWQYKAEENNITMVCQWCGKEFQGNKYAKPKTCCKHCADQLSIHNRKHRKDR